MGCRALALACYSSAVVAWRLPRQAGEHIGMRVPQMAMTQELSSFSAQLARVALCESSIGALH